MFSSALRQSLWVQRPSIFESETLLKFCAEDITDTTQAVTSSLMRECTPHETPPHSDSDLSTTRRHITPTARTLRPREDKTTRECTPSTHGDAGVPPKRSRKRLAPEERAQRRRKQHRELVARGRAKLRDHMTQLRTDGHALQQTIDTIVQNYTASQRKPSCELTEGAKASLRDRFVDAVVEEETIRKENQRLEANIKQKVKFQVAMMEKFKGIDAEEEAKASSTKAEYGQLLHRRGFWMHFAQDDEPFYYEPYTEATCEELMAQTYAKDQHLHESFTQRECSIMAVRCFGWNAQRMLDESSKNRLRFQFSKQIPTTSSSELRHDLSQKTWEILNTPTLYAELHRSAMTGQQLQLVGENTSVIIRNHPTKMLGIKLRSFNMMRAFTDKDTQGRNRTTLLILVLTPQDAESVASQASKGIVYIAQGFTSVSFVEVDSQTLEVTYGGQYGGEGQEVTEQHAAGLLVEIGCMWLRWENMVLPQRMLSSE